MDTGTYGYEATPLATQATGASFDTLVTGPGGSALVGRLHASERRAGNGRDASIRTSTSCRPSCCATARLNWVTRGVYFGDQRNYYEANIDDNFLSDDGSYTPGTGVGGGATDYNPADALRESPTDVATAASWGRQPTTSGSTCCSTAAGARRLPPTTAGPIFSSRRSKADKNDF